MTSVLVDGLATFLGVTFVNTRSDEQERLFKRHGASASPQASIGRWRTTDEMTVFRDVAGPALDEFNDVFGYGS